MPSGLSIRKELCIRKFYPIVSFEMRNLLTLTITALSVAVLTTSSFAGSCGGCPGEKGEKDKEKTEEGTQS